MTALPPRAPSGAGPDGLIGVADIARLLDVSVCTVQRRRARWEREGMPRPLPWRAAPLAWRRAEIVDWIARAERRAGARRPAEAQR